MNDEIQRFVKERDEALMSLDEGKIKAMYLKHGGIPIILEGPHFWVAVHKAITGAVGIPIEFRRKSKQWLTDKGYQSMDDGDL